MKGFKRIACMKVAQIYGRKKDLSDWKNIVRANFYSGDRLQIENFEFDTDNFLYFRAKAIKADEPNGNGDYFPLEEIKKAYKTFCGVGFYIEHNSDDPENAKGIILDAVLDEENKEVECLAAISKKDEPELCKDIKNKKIKSVSMGCIAEKAECSICGNLATSMDDICEHMNPNNPFTYIKGKVMPDGNVAYEINYDITFKELSGVQDPAWEEADIISVKANLRRMSDTLAKHYHEYIKAKKEAEENKYNEIKIEKIISKILDEKLKAKEENKEVEDKKEPETIEEKIDKLYEKAVSDALQKANIEVEDVETIANDISSNFEKEIKKQFKNEELEEVKKTLLGLQVESSNDIKIGDKIKIKWTSADGKEEYDEGLVTQIGKEGYEYKKQDNSLSYVPIRDYIEIKKIEDVEASQFNVIKYINELDISDDLKKSLENYINSDQFEEDVDNYSGTIEERSKKAIDDKLSDIKEIESEKNNKNYYIQENIGKAKYLVNFHDGEKKHEDGSPFYDVKIFNNKKDLEQFISQLKEEGYVEKSSIISEKTQKVRCNWCMKVFDEEKINVKDDKEYCPFCGETGYLMDLEDDSDDVKSWLKESKKYYDEYKEKKLKKFDKIHEEMADELGITTGEVSLSDQEFDELLKERLMKEGYSEEAADEYVKDIYLPLKEFNKQLTSSWIKSYDVVERGDNYTIIESVDGKPEIEYEKGKDVYHGWVDEIVNDVFIIKGDDGLPDEAYDLLEKYMKKNYPHLKSFGDITNVSSKWTKSSEDEIDIFVEVLKPSGDLLLSTIKNGIRYHKRYNGYTEEEAKEDFKNYINKLLSASYDKKSYKGTYEIRMKNVDGEWSTIGYESNKKRAISEAEKLFEEKQREIIVKDYLSGKTIFHQNKEA